VPADGLTIGFPRAVESHQGLFSDGNLFGAVKNNSALGMPHAAESNSSSDREAVSVLRRDHFASSLLGSELPRALAWGKENMDQEPVTNDPNNYALSLWILAFGRQKQ
jgi:hypothetical protein